MAKWQKQREEWGFDERETWSLDYAFALWLYERLKVYNQINIIDTSFHKIKYKEETLSFQDCIDRMIEGLKIRIIDEFNWNLDADQIEKVEDAMQLFALCYHYLWW